MNRQELDKQVKRLAEDLSYETSYTIVINKGCPDWHILNEMYKDGVAFIDLQQALKDCGKHIERTQAPSQTDHEYTITPLEQKKDRTIVCVFDSDMFKKSDVMQMSQQDCYKRCEIAVNQGEGDLYTIEDFEASLNNDEVFEGWYRIITIPMTDEEYAGWFK